MSSELEHMTQTIVAAADPEQVVLFGSRAQGSQSPSSDYDFALIFRSGEQARAGLRRANRALWPRRYPIDLVALTAGSYEAGTSVLAREVATTGRVLYGRTQPFYMEEPKQWLAYAMDDLAYGQMGLESLPRAASWSFQQASEKALKGLLLARTGEATRTHDVAYILNQLDGSAELLDEVKDAALLIAEITPVTRYPSDDLPPI